LRSLLNDKEKGKSWKKMITEGPDGKLWLETEYPTD